MKSKLVLGTLMACTCFFVKAQTNGNVGIGESNPGSKLSVKGGIAVGSNYSSQTAPDGNMIIEKGLGIGTSVIDTNAVLDIRSTTKGIKLPSMNTSTIQSIHNPSAGLLLFNTDSAAFNFYNGTSWLNFALIGPTGPVGAAASWLGLGGSGSAAAYSASSTTLLTIGTGTKIITTQSGLSYHANDRVRIANSSNKYMEGVVTTYLSGILTVSVDRVAGSGTYTSWTIGIAGDIGLTGATGATGATGTAGADGAKGATGATGADGQAADHYETTSSTSISIGTGSKSFTVDAGLAYTIGQSVIVSNTSSKLMNGTVTAYNPATGAMTVNVTSKTGSGTYSSWYVNLSGYAGAVGATGDTGPQGPTGADGATGATWLSGTSAPSAGQGNINDMYIDASNNKYYTKTDVTTWTLLGTLSGPTGATGPQGPAGNDGINGADGAPGARGATGVTGPQGPAGTNGVTGATGPQGPAGANGANGATGAAGIAGIAGTNGATWITGTSAPTGGQGNINDLYLNTTNSTYYLKTASTSWTSKGSLIGATGATGANGTNGTNGVTGATGATGPTGSTNGWLLTGNSISAGNFIGSTNNYSFRVRTNNTERMVVDSTGNVGIGITSPTTGLHCVFNSSGKNVITIQNTNSTGYSSMDFISNSGALSSTFGFANSGTGGIFSSRAYMNSYNNDFVLTNNSSTYAIFIKGADGKVGINNSSPGYELDVAGDINLSGALRVSGSAGSAGQVLTANGTGGVSWSAPSGSNLLATNAITLSTSNNNINIGSGEFIKISGPTAAFNITGIASGTDGERIILYNSTGYNMTIKNQSGSSSSSNRISTTTGSDITTTGEGSATLIYDGTQSRWVLLNLQQ